MATIAASVDTLINRAITERPELAEVARQRGGARGAGSRRALGGLSVAHAQLERRARQSLAGSADERLGTSTTRCSSACRFRSSTASRGSTTCAPRAAQYEAGLARVQSTRQQITRAGVHVVRGAAHVDRDASRRRPSCSPARRCRRTARSADIARASARSPTCCSRAARSPRRAPRRFRRDGNGRPRSRSSRTTSARSTSAGVRTSARAGGPAIRR